MTGHPESFYYNFTMTIFPSSSSTIIFLLSSGPTLILFLKEKKNDVIILSVAYRRPCYYFLSMGSALANIKEEEQRKW